VELPVGFGDGVGGEQGVFIWPSMMTCKTCIPCGPNSLDIDCASALKPNLPTTSAEKRAEPRKEAVAPVSKIVPCPVSTIATLPLADWSRVRHPQTPAGERARIGRGGAG
jgi:hypothetical protein